MSYRENGETNEQWRPSQPPAITDFIPSPSLSRFPGEEERSLGMRLSDVSDCVVFSAVAFSALAWLCVLWKALVFKKLSVFHKTTS